MFAKLKEKGNDLDRKGKGQGKGERVLHGLGIKDSGDEGRNFRTCYRYRVSLGLISVKAGGFRFFSGLEVRADKGIVAHNKGS